MSEHSYTNEIVSQGSNPYPFELGCSETDSEKAIDMQVV